MEKIDTEIKKALESKVFIKVIKIVGVAVAVLLIFYAGISVGFHKASFGRDWGEHYNENFGFGGPSGRMMGFNNFGVMNSYPNAHGAAGKVIKTEIPNIIVEGNDNTEKSILIGTDTKIQKGSATILATDLQVNDFVIVIGSPNPQGVIEAKLIRVLPNPALLK